MVKMLARMRTFIDEELSLSLLWITSIVTFIVSKIIQIQLLDKSYSDSKFPVPFYEGQTTFDAIETKAHFQVLIENNTLDVFWRTQLIDFVYILATFLFTIFAIVSVYKMLAFSIKLQRISWHMIFLMPLNAILDVFENLVSFIMLSNPTDFANWLIIPYSSFAVAKFTFYLIGYLWIIAALFIKLFYVKNMKKPSVID